MITREIENINYTNYEIGCLLEITRDYINDMAGNIDARKIDIISILVDTCIDKNEKNTKKASDLVKRILESGIQNDGK